MIVLDLLINGILKDELENVIDDVLEFSILVEGDFEFDEFEDLFCEEDVG